MQDWQWLEREALPAEVKRSIKLALTGVECGNKSDRCYKFYHLAYDLVAGDLQQTGLLNEEWISTGIPRIVASAAWSRKIHGPDFLPGDPPPIDQVIGTTSQKQEHWRVRLLALTPPPRLPPPEKTALKRNWLDERLHEAGTTVTKLRRFGGPDRNTIENWIRDKTKPQPSFYGKMANSLNAAAAHAKKSLRIRPADVPR
jgi:hypothetical protein